MKEIAIKLTISIVVFFCFPIKAQWLQVADFGGTSRDDLISFTCVDRAFAGTGMEVGFQVTNDFYEYNAGLDQWVSIASLPGISRQYAFSFSFASKGCVYAGINQSGLDLKDGYVYDPQNNSWTIISPYPGNGSRGCAAASVNNFGYAGLGRNNANVLFNDWWQYDLIGNTWLQKADFPGLARNLVACFESNGYIYVVGGLGDNNIALGDVWQYNPQNDSWLALTSLMTQPISSAASCKVKYSGVMIGGYDGQSNFTDNALFLDGFNNLWNNLPPIPVDGERKGAKAFSINGELFVTCGITAANTRLKSTWKYNLINKVEQQDLLTNGFCMYPNPAHECVYIKATFPSNTTYSKYCILNQDGSEIKKGILPTLINPFKIETETIPPGCYLMKLFNSNNVFFEKLIITP